MKKAFRPSPTVGDLIRNARLSRGMTQMELADRAGVTIFPIQQSESNRQTKIRNDTLLNIIVALNDNMELSDKEKTDIILASGSSPEIVPGLLAKIERLTSAKKTAPQRYMSPQIVDVVREIVRLLGEPNALHQLKLTLHIASQLNQSVSPWPAPPSQDTAPAEPPLHALKTVTIEDNVKVTKYHPTTSPQPPAQRAKRIGA